MQIREDFELLESLFVELDPLEDGFVGVLLEIYRQGDRYVLLETTPAAGNRNLRFSSRDKELIYAVFVATGAGSATRKRQSSTGELLREPADYPGEG